MIVEVRKRTGQIQSLWVKKIAREVLKKLKLRESELSIKLVDNREIKKLNRVYRQINKPTDVLAFPQREGKFNKIHPEILGDIVISLPQARLQARKLGHSLRKETAILIIHGILHLLGHKDEKKSEREKIFLKQNRLLSYLEKKDII